MATGVVHSCKKTDYGIHQHKLNGSQYGPLFGVRKRARKSKGVQGITIKKSVSQDISFQRDDGIPGFKDVAWMHLEKKRKHGCDNGAVEVVVCSVRVKKSQVSSTLQ
ncbi:hypothetical protein Pfo_011649, partial [Paulownia fortunei]